MGNLGYGKFCSEKNDAKPALGGKVSTQQRPLQPMRLNQIYHKFHATRVLMLHSNLLRASGESIARTFFKTQHRAIQELEQE